MAFLAQDLYYVDFPGLLLRKGQVILYMNQGIFFDNSPSLPTKKPIMEIHFYLDSLGRIINTGSMPGMRVLIQLLNNTLVPQSLIIDNNK